MLKSWRARDCVAKYFGRITIYELFFWIYIKWGMESSRSRRLIPYGYRAMSMVAKEVRCPTGPLGRLFECFSM
jgi:hypothetical protein